MKLAEGHMKPDIFCNKYLQVQYFYNFCRLFYLVVALITLSDI